MSFSLFVSPTSSQFLPLSCFFFFVPLGFSSLKVRCRRTGEWWRFQCIEKSVQAVERTAHPAAIISNANNGIQSLRCLFSDTAEMSSRHTQEFPRGGCFESWSLTVYSSVYYHEGVKYSLLVAQITAEERNLYKWEEWMTLVKRLASLSLENYVKLKIRKINGKRLPVPILEMSMMAAN